MDTTYMLSRIQELYDNSSYTDLALQAFSEMRNISVDVLKKNYIFHAFDNDIIRDMWGSSAYSMGLYYGETCLFNKRMIFPLFDFKGNIVSIAGYSDGSLTDVNGLLIKYLFTSETFFKKSRFIYITPEEITKAYDDGYIFIVDGFMDKIRLVSEGYNATALYGSYISNYHRKYLEPIKHKIVLGDNDEAGLKMVKQLKSCLTGVTSLKQGLAHDIDDYLKDESNLEKFKEAFSLIKSTGFSIDYTIR